MSTSELQIDTENLPGSLIGVQIEVPSPEVDRAFDRVLTRLQQRVKIEGFRPGKAPRALVEARLGSGAVREEAIDLLVPEVVSQALREKSISAIDNPKVEIAEFERGRPARFTARVTVLPQVTLPDLDQIQVARPATEVDDKMVEERITALRERLAEVEPVEREAQMGDVLVVDLEVAVDGQELESERRRGMEVQLEAGVLIPELVAQLPGKNVGETAQAEVKMADDHANPELQGKLARLTMTVRGVKEKHLPELSLEVVKQLSGGEQETEEALRRAVREDLVAQAHRTDRLQLEQAVLQAVVDASQLEVPEALVERDVDARLHELEHQLASQGVRLEKYFEYVGKGRAEVASEMQSDAVDRVRADLVLGQVGTDFAIEVSDAEVTSYIEAEAPEAGELAAADLVSNPVAVDYFRHRLVRLRTLEMLIDKVAPKAAQPSPEVSGPGSPGPDSPPAAEEEGV